MTAFDAEIVCRYTRGQSTNQIARDLDLRLADVIGRVRALDLQPPSMSQRLSPAPAEAVAAKAGSEPVQEPTPENSAPIRRTADLKPDGRQPTRHAGTDAAAEMSEDRNSEDAEDEPRKRPGCANGWLISEDKFAALFHPGKGRFEDAPIRPKPRKPVPQPIGSLTGQEPASPAPDRVLMAAE